MSVCPDCGRAVLLLPLHRLTGCDGADMAVRAGVPSHLPGRLRVGAPLGAGGMGRVFEVHGPGGPFAVKFLPVEHTREHRRALERELTALGQVAHPSVVRLVRYDLDGDHPHLLLERVAGEPLRAWLDRGLAPAMGVSLVREAARGVGAAHAIGLVHRDLKAENILVVDEPAMLRVKVIDFGLAQSATGESSAGSSSGVLGSASTMSPEQVTGLATPPATDVYALGVLLFEVLSGRRPFDRATPVLTAMAHLNDPVPSLPTWVSQPMAALVTACLDKRPAGRPSDGEVLASELDRQLAEGLTR